MSEQLPECECTKREGSITDYLNRKGYALIIEKFMEEQDEQADG